MNDLDDLIRTSLHAHTSAAAPDAGLAGRVTAAGRRIRRIRRAGVAAVVLVAVAGVTFAATTLPRLSRPVIAASPTVPQPTAVLTTPGRPTPGADATVRDVSTVGAPSEYETYTFLNNSFASPSGNLHCFISASGAGCAGREWDAGVQPSQKETCSDSEPVLGPEVWGKRKAAWACGGDPHSLPYLGDEGGASVDWWDAAFGESVKDENARSLAVLPYGKTLVAGDFRCTMAEEGVTCRNTSTGHGFHASRGKVDLKP